MDSSWHLKCGSTLPSSMPAMASSTSQEARDLMEINSVQYVYSHAGQDLRSQVRGKMPDPAFPSFAYLSSCTSSQTDLGSSFLALLSGPASLLHFDFQELSNPKPFITSSKLPMEIGNITVSPTGSQVPLTSNGLLSENGSYQNLQSGADLYSVVSTRAAASSNSVFQNGLPSANITLQGSDVTKTLIHHTVNGNEKVKDFPSLKEDCHGTPLINAVKLHYANNQIPLKVPLEADSSAFNNSSTSTSGCPRVFCLDRSGDLLLSNTGLLGILCSCHCFHMSVSKFCEHSGLLNVNPGDAVHMDSGETIAQWRKLYFQKFGIRVPEDQSGWDWPEGLSLTASLVKSGVSLSSMPKNSDCSSLVGATGGLARSGQSLAEVFPKNFLADQNSLIAALHDNQQRNGQDSNEFYLKGLIANPQSNSCRVGDNGVTDCSISRCLTMPKFAGRGPENGCQSIYNDANVKSGSLATTHQTLHNHGTPVKSFNVSRGKDAKHGANIDKDASSSSIELKLGQPYQHNQSLGSPVLPVIGQQFYNTLVNSQRPFSQEQMIHNVTSCRGEEESRLLLPCAAGRSNSTIRREQNQLNYGNCAINDTMYAAKPEILKGNMTKTSVVSLCKHHTLPQGSSHSKATNNLPHSKHVRRKTQHCESYAVKCDPVIVPWRSGNGLDRQHMVPESGFLKTSDKGKGVGCLGGNSYTEKASGSKMRKWMENANYFTGVVSGNNYSVFPLMHDKSCYSHHMSNVPPDASDTGHFFSCLEKGSCSGSSGPIDHVFLRSKGSSTDSRQILSSHAVPIGSPLSTSTAIPGLIPAMPNQESIGIRTHLLDDNLRLLALGQILELSKQQHALSSLGYLEQGKCSNSSNVKVQHSFVEPSTSEEQRPKLNFNRKEDLSEGALKLDQSGPTSETVNDVDKFASVTGSNRWCNFSTLTQGMALACKEIGMQCPLSHNPVQNVEPPLRLSRSQNNIAHSNEHENCCQRTVHFHYKCSCAAHTCIGGQRNLECGNPPSSLREQTGSVNCQIFAKDHIVPKENAVSFDQYGTLKGQLPRNINFHASQWKDVPSKVKSVCEVSCVNLDGREHEFGQLEDSAAKCSNEAVQLASSFKEKDMSNISSGCSAPAVTQASIEVTNVDSSIVVGNNRYVNNLIVDEGSGIDKSWSSDDAFESERSADFYGSSCMANLRKEGSCKAVGNKFSRSLLDEVKLMNSLTWKKGLNKKHSGITDRVKTNQSQESQRALKTGKRKRQLELEMLDPSLHTEPHELRGKYPECDGIADWPCLTKNVQMISSGPDSSRTSGPSVKINPKQWNSALSATKARKIDLHRLYNAGDGENDHDTEINHNDKPCKIIEISGRKKLKGSWTADNYLQFQMQESTQAVGGKGVKHDSVSCIKASSSRQVNLCLRKEKPVVCGKYGEIISGNVTGEMMKPFKIVSLDRVLKTARKCSLPQNCKPRLTSSKGWKRKNCSWSNGCFDKFSNLRKEKESRRNDALVCAEMDIYTSLEETDLAFASGDEQSAGEFSMLEKREEISGKGDSTLDTNAHACSKPKYKETRKRSLFELTLKGKNPSSKMVSQKKNFKRAPKIMLGKILKNSDKSHVHGSWKVDAKRYVREQKHLSVTDMDSFCCVCGSSNKDEVNCLLDCEQCSIRVHQACYGVSKVPKGYWYCRPCKTSSTNIVCVLCGYGGGAMTRALQSSIIVKTLLKAWNLETECGPTNATSSVETVQDDLSMLHSSGYVPGNSSCPVLRPVNIDLSTSTICNMDVQNQLVIKNSLCHVSNLKIHNSITAGIFDSSVKQWVHMVCGLWTPGTRCPNVDTMSAFDVSGVPRPRENLVCSICNRPGGSCIQCRAANCSVQFHPWCAHQKGLLQSETEGVDNENVGFYGRCVLHAMCLANESACDAITEAGCAGKSCARTEGYKGRKRDGFWHNINGQSKGKGGCLVPQDQLNAWIHINGQKSCTQGLLKLPISEKEYDCRKEYARYKQSKGWKHLVVYKSGIHALGLYTSWFISRGEMVVEYVGEIVGLRVADKRENEYQSGRKLQYKSACYFFRIDKEHIIDATRKGGIARFVNHSCLPNCVAKVISVRNEKKVVFFAERDIYPGEEITYDYHFNHEDEGKKIPCFCNSRNCRRYLN